MLTKIGENYLDLTEIVAAIHYPGDQYDGEHFDCQMRSGEWASVMCGAGEFERILDRAGVLSSDLQDGEEPSPPSPYLAYGELDALRQLYKDGYQYLARDKNGALYAFQQRPQYDGCFWDYPQPTSMSAKRIYEGMIFVVADDEEPTEIAPLLAPYLD